jgi:Flp pilus assembly protein TadD/ketosteroid isomerase-like protein
MLTGNLVRGSLAALLLSLGTFALAAPADDVKEASRLYQQGKLDAALAKVNGALAAQPKDAQGRFLKGLIYTEQKKTADAIQIFTGLTEDFPELPEPYNNLAVLYASQGNYDKAKAALELAIHTHPSYATAHENLGDIYAQLARRAYDKALQLDKTNTTAQAKLAMVKDLFSAPKSIAPEPAKTAPVQVAKADPVKAPPTTPATVVPATASPTPSAKAEVQKPAVVAAATPAGSPTVATAATTAPAASGSSETQVTNAVQAWARAWAARDVAGYLAAYAQDFETPDGLTRAAWEAQRKQRISAASSITVDIKMNKVTVKGDEATAVFRQTYKSDKVSSKNTKTLKLVKSGDRWLIRSERAGG